MKFKGKFNEALRENKDAKIFLTPGGSTQIFGLIQRQSQETQQLTNNLKKKVVLKLLEKKCKCDITIFFIFCFFFNKMQKRLNLF